MNIIITILATGYFSLIFLILIGLVFFNNKKHSNNLTASIVIVARNEQEKLPILLESLCNIDYPEDKYEILLVDDNSDDNTGRIMEEYCSAKANWHTYFHEKNEKSLKGKKGAISMAIEKSVGEIILITDADCVVPPNWIKSMTSCFDPKTSMVLGCSPVMRKKGFFNIYQRFDTLCESCLAASTTFYNKPSHSNARNLAFRKSVFNEVGGYQSISHVDTGDDYYLTKLFRTTTKSNFKYNMDSNSSVITDEIGFGAKYVHQQLRRNSKAFDLTLPFFIMGAFIFLFHLSLLIMVFIPSAWSLLGKLLIAKFIIEIFPVIIGAIRFKEKGIIPWFPILWLLYPVFYLSSQILGSLHLHKWK